MPYTVRLYNEYRNAISGSISVADETLNITDTDLMLVGNDYVDFSRQIAESFVWHLENFSGTNAPMNPLKGQLWFDDSIDILKIYNGVSWEYAMNLSAVSTDVLPLTTNTYDLGSALKTWNTLYVTTLSVGGITLIDPLANLRSDGSVTMTTTHNGDLISGAITDGKAISTKGYVDNRESVVQAQVTANTNNIATNTSDILTNTSDIITNTLAIAVNTAAISALQNAMWPIGSIYENATNSTNPADISMLGFGTWSTFNPGRVTICVGTLDTKTYTAGSSNPATNHSITLQASELPPHSHEVYAAVGYTGTGNAIGDSVRNSTATPDIYTSGITGSGAAHDNMPPYIVVYRWVRTA